MKLVIFSAQMPSPAKFSIQNADKVVKWWISGVPVYDIPRKKHYYFFSALYLQTISSLASQSLLRSYKLHWDRFPLQMAQ